MPRPNRLSKKNGIYHVMNRGAGRRHIFVSDLLKQLFIHTLMETKIKYNFLIHAFCIMGNHYHLLIGTPDGNLSDGMRYLNSRYARAFNHYRLKDGPIFRGRFKSLLISSEHYLLNVTRYIHLNPVEAGVATSPDDYLWSSYLDFVGNPKGLDIVSPLPIQLDPDDYAIFVNHGNSLRIKEFYSKHNLKKEL